VRRLLPSSGDIKFQSHPFWQAKRAASMRFAVPDALDIRIAPAGADAGAPSTIA
jgi:hypothetical protein